MIVLVAVLTILPFVGAFGMVLALLMLVYIGFLDVRDRISKRRLDKVSPMTGERLGRTA